MHIVLMLTVVGSLLWGLIALTPNLLQKGWPLAVAVPFIGLVDVFWGVSMIYVIDLLNSHYRKNNEFLRKFYAELHSDLLTVLVLAVVLLVIFSLARTSYSLSSIDVACLGLPMFICALDSLARSKDPSGILTMSLTRRLILMALPAGLLIASCWVLVEILSNEFSASASLWLQLCILFAGFTSYVGSKQTRYFMLHRRLGISPTIMALLRKVRGAGSPAFYEQTAQMAEKFQRDLNVATAKAAADKRRLARTSRKKR
ncbi:hypothetical protein I5U25_06565 [Stenotrophomonas maltophilia]|nr:hypothetical protein [Stenotrophomonas maltophilia]